MSETERSGVFHVGDRVRVRHGVSDDEYGEFPLGGWAGTIEEVHEDGLYVVRWSQETLEAIHPVYHKRCERDGTDVGEYWLGDGDLEPDPGGPLDIEQPTNIVTRPLDPTDQADRVRAVFELTSDDPLPEPNRNSELRYYDYLKVHLSFPFEAGYRDRVKAELRPVVVVAMLDEFPVDETYGAMCKAKDDERDWELPFSRLEVEAGNPNCQLVDDYIYWHVNAPEPVYEDGWEEEEGWDEEDEDESEYGDDWDEEEDGEDDDWEEDAEDALDQQPSPPPSRQKVGRNDPCPCGSGKKFKKCCMRKQDSDLPFE